MKLVVEQSSQKIVGTHMLDDDAPEMMQGIAVAITAGATKADFDQTVGNSSHRGGGVGHDADPDPCCGCGGESGGVMTPLGPAMRGHFDVSLKRWRFSRAGAITKHDTLVTLILANSPDPPEPRVPRRRCASVG